jgi:AGZA family xanthine/uracil permease-like MFS transporter
VLNPLIIGLVPDGSGQYLGGGAEPNLPAIAAGTALVAGVMSLLMGVVARFPLALATGLGLNAAVAYSVAALPGMTWADAMGIVVLEGLVILVLVLTGFREAVFAAVPGQLKIAISVGIGLFIALIGLVDGGIVRPGAGVPLTLGVGGELMGWPAVANVGGRSEDNPGGWGLEVPRLEGSIARAPDFATLGQFSLLGSVQAIGAVAVVLLVFSLMLADFFDTMGTMVAIGGEAGLLRPDGTPPRTRQILAVDSLAAVAGGAGGVSSNTSYIESAAGVGDGARTGLASVVTGLAFLAAIFLAPLAALVPYEAATPALVVVGFLMMMQVSGITWNRYEIAIPAFLTIVLMPFTYSITVGIGAGFVSHVVLVVAKGEARRIHPLMWGVAGAFVVYFLLGPIRDAIGI